MLKLIAATMSASAIAATALAQTAQPGATSPSITPSQTPAVTPSPTPAGAPSQMPVVTPSQTPVINSPAPAVGGLSPCENLIGVERDNCLKDDRARAGDSAGRGATGPTR